MVCGVLCVGVCVCVLGGCGVWFVCVVCVCVSCLWVWMEFCVVCVIFFNTYLFKTCLLKRITTCSSVRMCVIVYWVWFGGCVCV